jgi:ATP-dependent protease HslVU (ClpYQ) peptidase subunit
MQKKGQSDLRYMSTVVVDEIRACFGKYWKMGSTEEGGTFIVVYKDQIYLIESDFQIGRVNDSYVSCGCGQRYACGAMHALLGGKTNVSGKRKVLLALQAAEHHSLGVRGPFNIISKAY